MLPRRALAALPLALLAACSSSAPSFAQPRAAAFRTGACRDAAPAVLALGRDAHALSGGDVPDEALSARLKDNQNVLAAAQPGLSTDLQPSFSALVISVGVLRLRTDTNTYDAKLAATVLADYRAVVAACTPSSSG